jgi:hypothetical protein
VLAITEAGKNSLAGPDDRLLGRKAKMGFTLRRATACDAEAIVKVHWASFRLLTFLPMLHTAEEYRWFVSNVTLKECEVTVAEDESGSSLFSRARV